jgi:hypothetical protein
MQTMAVNERHTCLFVLISMGFYVTGVSPRVRSGFTEPCMRAHRLPSMRECAHCGGAFPFSSGHQGSRQHHEPTLTNPPGIGSLAMLDTDDQTTID